MMVSVSIIFFTNIKCDVTCYYVKNNFCRKKIVTLLEKKIPKNKFWWKIIIMYQLSGLSYLLILLYFRYVSFKFRMDRQTASLKNTNMPEMSLNYGTHSVKSGGRSMVRVALISLHHSRETSLFLNVEHAFL